MARSGQEMVEAILRGLKWLGLDWDEEIVRQSDRIELYKQHTARLIEAGTAYKCFCSKEELDRRRQQAAKKKREYKYRDQRTCLNLKPADARALEAKGQSAVVRFMLPEGQTVFVDEVFGEIRVNHSQLDDFILLRSDGFPTYHLAVVADDHEMGISHIIRGDDHLSNTPKHVLLYQAFGWSCPVFAHVPLILGPDKQRLSKRHSATAVGEYEKAGYLPEAVLNFLSLLGWSSGDDRELFKRDELIQACDLRGIQKKSAVFDETKLEWMNGQYLMEMEAEQVLELAAPRLLEAALVRDEDLSADKERLLKIMRLLQPRLKKLSEIVRMSHYFFKDPGTYEEKAMQKHWKHPGLIEQFEILNRRLETMEQLSAENTEPVIRVLAEESDTSAAKIIQPLRLALTGISFSPGIFEVIELLGKERVLRRIRKAVDFLQERTLVTDG